MKRSTKHPTAQWTAQQVVEAFPWDEAPRSLLRDRDRIYADVPTSELDFTFLIRYTKRLISIDVLALDIGAATTMFQRLKRLKSVFGLYLNRQNGLALLERVESSDLSAEDRARVSRILRTMLTLSDAPGQGPSSPEVSTPSAPTASSRRRQRPAS